MKFDETGTFTYPSYINEVAENLGKFRTQLNSDLHKTTDEYSRGDKGIAVDILGIKGELLIQHFLFSKNIEFSAAKIIDEKPVIEPDIIIGDSIKIDVKAVRSDGTVLMVNEKAHYKGKGITHYWFVKPINETTCKYWIFKYDEVSDWSLKFVGFTNAYCMPLDHLIKFDFSALVKNEEDENQI